MKSYFKHFVTNFQNFPKISEDIQRIPKISHNFRRFHKKNFKMLEGHLVGMFVFALSNAFS